MHKRIYIRGMVLLFVMLLALPVGAQNDLPPIVRDAALDAAEEALGSRAPGWTFTLLSPTTDRSLGCPLVEGETMAQEVTPYRVELSYDDGRYVVFVSADGRMAQLCDSKFGEAAMNATPDPSQQCISTPYRQATAYIAPDEEATAAFPVLPSEGYDALGRSSDERWVQVVSNEDNVVGWVQVQFLSLPTPCNDLPTTGYTLRDESTCFVTPASAFSNVRERPTTDAPQVARIYENTVFEVQATNTGGSWLYIQPGWVAGQVLQTLTPCGDLPVDESLVGIGFTGDDSDVPFSIQQSVSRAQAQYPCPADFDGYLAPRLEVGMTTAQVEDGGLPNTLRSFPNVDDSIGERLGAIQPGRTINRVLAGPVCNQGFVWWLVEFDGTTGWTAESNAANDTYFLTTGTADTATTDGDSNEGFQQPTPTPADDNTASDDGVQLVESVTIGADDTADEPLNAIQHAQINAASTGVYVSVNLTRDSEQEGQVVVVALTDPPQVSAGRLADLDGVFDLAETTYDGTAALAVGLLDGRIVYYDIASEFAELGSLEDAISFSGRQAGFAFAPDGSQFAVSRCADAACLTSTLEMIDTVTGEVLWSQTPDGHQIQDIAYAADGTTLVTAGSVFVADGANSGDVRVWNAADGSEQGRYTNDDMLPVNAIDINDNTGQIIFVNCATVAANGETCTQGRIGLLDGESVSLQGVINAYDAAITHVVYTPDDARFAVAAGDAVQLRNSATGALLETVSIANDGVITALDYSGDRLIIGTDMGSLYHYTVGALSE